MIYTITFNPALDYIVSVKRFNRGLTNRTSAELLLPGGKGINVSIVLQNLGIESVALGFIAGFTGEEIKRMLEEQGCKTDFVTVPKGFSRINVKMQNVDGTEINGAGPEIDEESLNRLWAKLDDLQDGDVLVLAGSIPASLPDDIYREIIERISHKEIKVVVDASRGLLANVLPLKPFLVKPNHHELGELFDVELKKASDVIPYARKLQQMGAGNVLVSMAGEGAVLAAQNGETYVCPAPKGKLINAVGAGDSMVAGFLAGFMDTGDYERAFKMGVAAGSASAFSELLATKEQVDNLLEDVTKQLTKIL